MIFKRNSNYLIHRILVSHFFTIILLFQKNINFNVLVLVWFITVVLFNFVISFTKNLKEIEIQEHSIRLVFNNHFKEVTELYDYGNLKFTNKIEISGAKGAKSREFRIYKNCNDKRVASIGGLIDGWSKDIIYEIIEELNKLGIEVIE